MARRGDERRRKDNRPWAKKGTKRQAKNDRRRQDAAITKAGAREKGKETNS